MQAEYLLLLYFLLLNTEKYGILGTKICKRTSIKPLIFLIYILRVNVYDIAVINVNKIG